MPSWVYLKVCGLTLILAIDVAALAVRSRVTVLSFAYRLIVDLNGRVSVSLMRILALG